MNKNYLTLIFLTLALIFLPMRADSSSYRIVVLKGDKQALQVGTGAKDPIMLKVVDTRGYPAKAVVKLNVVKGEAKLSGLSVNTDSSGRVKVYLKAGFVPGETVVKAMVDKMPGSGVTLRYFVTLGKPGSYAELVKQADKNKKPAPPKAPIKPRETPAEKPTPEKVPVKEVTPKEEPSKDVTSPDETPEPASTEKPDVTTGTGASVIVSYRGNGQRVDLNSMTKHQMVVQLMDAQGAPVKNEVIEFEVEDGEAVMMPARTVTDDNGMASVNAKVGGTAGDIVIRAYLSKNKELSTVFNLKAVEKVVISPDGPKPVPVPEGTPEHTTPRTTTPETPVVPPDTIKLPPKPNTRPRGTYSREPASLDVVAGNFQFAEPGVRLTQPIVVYVTDADGNPTFGTVSFTVMSGNATIINKEVKTDGRGLASTFVVVNSRQPVKVVAEIIEKPGLSTIAYANMAKKEPKKENENRNPIIEATTRSNTPGYPASIAFYEMRTKNTTNIEKTSVVQLEIGVSDFRNMPVSTAIKFSVLKGKVKILNPIVQTGSDGKGICYVEVGGSMGIFTVEAQSLENPDLRAIFKSGPEIRTGPAPRVVRPGGEEKPSDMEVAPPPTSTTPTGEPALVAVVSGGGQRGKARSKLPQPMVVLVTDAKGNPIEGAMVQFYTQSGRFVIHSPYARTNSTGKAQTYITLGKQPGMYEVGVKVRGSKDLKTTIQVIAE